MFNNFLTKNLVKQIDEAVELKAFIDKLTMGTTFTPDVATLERRQYQFLFVGDEMMSKHAGHAWLGFNARKVANVVTQDKFSLWKKDLGKFTRAIPLTVKYYDAPVLPVRGELFLIPSQQFFKLDTHRENGVQFNRERVKIALPYTEVNLRYGQLGYYEEHLQKLDKTLNAYMYVGITDFWDNLLDAGYAYRPVKNYKPNNPLLEKYYYFTINEYGSG